MNTYMNYSILNRYRNFYFNHLLLNVHMHIYLTFYKELKKLMYVDYMNFFGNFRCIVTSFRMPLQQYYIITSVGSN